MGQDLLLSRNTKCLQQGVIWVAQNVSSFWSGLSYEFPVAASWSKLVEQMKLAIVLLKGQLKSEQMKYANRLFPSLSYMKGDNNYTSSHKKLI